MPNLRRRRNAYKKKRRIPRNPRMGGTVLTRRVQTCYINNSNIFGAPVATNPPGATAMIQLGSIITNPYFGNNFTFPFVLTFSLDQLVQFTDITNFADRYKIKDVYIRMQYNSDSVTGVPTTGQNQPNIVPSMCYIADYDDSNVQTPTELNAKMGLKRKALNNGAFHLIKLKPKVAPAIYQAGVASAYAVPSSQTFINSSYPTVPHYGIKGYFENFFLGGIGAGCSQVTLDVVMKVQIKDFQ